ncbi:MAG: hypothetical protein EAZ15_04280 [Sphingobacteriales bacterium]|nr:MAG: hypothetical protein EAZ15_04280 [Sphingobacteriales bacterium]
MTVQQKKKLTLVIKIAVLLLATFFIVYKLNTNQNLENFYKIIKTLNPKQVYIKLSIVVLMMLLNWFLESLKWRYLVKRVERISLLKAVESVFCGLTWAIFTPNRIGEYGGRIFFLSPRKRIPGMVAMGVGHIAQMVITNVMGTIAVVWFVYNFVKIQTWLLPYFAFWGSVIAISLVVLYFNIRLINYVLFRVKFLKKYEKYFSVLSEYTKMQLLTVLLFSLVRFIVFTGQYVFILNFLIPNIPILPSALMVFILFLIQSALPSLDLLDIGVRSLTADYFFGYITPQSSVVIACAALIWLVNLIIPAILGSFFVFKLKFFGNNRN